MANQIKIPKEIAEATPRIKYVNPITGCNCEIDLRCSEQKTGEYLMDESTYLNVAEIPEVREVFKDIDFSALERITEKDIDLKE